MGHAEWSENVEVFFRCVFAYRSQLQETRKAFSKASLFAVHTDTIGLRFQKTPLWIAFSNVKCVSDEIDER